MGVVYHSSLAAITMFFSTRLGAATCICMVGTSTGKFISTFSFFFLPSIYLHRDVGAILYTLLLGHLLPKIGFVWTMHGRQDPFPFISATN